MTKDIIGKGGFFGEKALFNNANRNATIITSSVCEFLIINRKDFMAVSKNYDKRNTRMIEFMKKYIPDISEISNYHVLEDLLYLLHAQDFERGDHLANEGDQMDKLFLIFEGQCDLSKNIVLDES